MATLRRDSDEKLTFLVMKNGLAGRTFVVTESWIRRTGLTGLAAILLALFCSVAAMRAYKNYRARGGSESAQRVGELEKELSELRSSYEGLQAKLQAPTLAPSAGAPSTAAPVAPAKPLAVTSTMLFTALPGPYPPSLPDPASLPFKFDNRSVQWAGNTLRVAFAIQYTKEDGGNQQGHIVVLARGPETLMAYPDGVLSPAGSESLIRPESGEFFSVSRYREVKAEFGPVSEPRKITEVEILILNSNKQLIYSEKLTPQKAPERPKRKAPKEEEAPPAAASAPSAASAPVAAPATAPAPAEKKPEVSP